MAGIYLSSELELTSHKNMRMVVASNQRNQFENGLFIAVRPATGYYWQHRLPAPIHTSFHLLFVPATSSYSNQLPAPALYEFLFVPATSSY